VEWQRDADHVLGSAPSREEGCDGRVVASYNLPDSLNEIQAEFAW
jgi:hypothetical protein